MLHLGITPLTQCQMWLPEVLILDYPLNCDLLQCNVHGIIRISGWCGWRIIMYDYRSKLSLKPESSLSIILTVI